MRTPLIAGNWKMFKTVREAVPFVADLRAPTPTGAATLATPDGRELSAAVAALSARAERQLAEVGEVLWRVDVERQPLQRQFDDFQPGRLRRRAMCVSAVASEVRRDRLRRTQRQRVRSVVAGAHQHGARCFGGGERLHQGTDVVAPGERDVRRQDDHLAYGDAPCQVALGEGEAGVEPAAKRRWLHKWLRAEVAGVPADLAVARDHGDEVEDAGEGAGLDDVRQHRQRQLRAVRAVKHVGEAHLRLRQLLHRDQCSPHHQVPGSRFKVLRSRF
jgi:exonuclease VII large subunit